MVTLLLRSTPVKVCFAIKVFDKLGEEEAEEEEAEEGEEEVEEEAEEEPEEEEEKDDDEEDKKEEECTEAGCDLQHSQRKLTDLLLLKV